MTAAEERARTVGASLDEYAGRLTALSQTYNAQFAAEQQTREAQLAQMLAEERRKWDETRSFAMDEAKAGLDAIAETGAETLRALSKIESDARVILGALAERAVAAGYGKYADEQRKAADRLRMWAVAAGLAAIAWSVFVAIAAVGVAFEWAILLRFLAAVPMLLIAGYLIQQSGKHRDCERTARRSELELAALDPFLATLDPAKREQIKSDLASRMFAQTVTPDAPPRIFDQLIDLLREAIKKG